MTNESVHRAIGRPAEHLPQTAPPSSSDDDDALVERVRTGDAQAFEALFRAYYAPLCTYATVLVASREDAEELVQDVWSAVWAQRHRWEVHESVAAYLFRAARNRALGWLRRRRVAERWQQDTAAQESSVAVGAWSADPHDALVQAEGIAALRRGVAALPERCRQVFLLRQRGLSHREIAEAMGIRPATVEVQMWKALRALRRSVAPWSER